MPAWLLAALLTAPVVDEWPVNPVLAGCVEAIVPRLETAVAGGLPTPSNRELLARSGDAAVDAAVDDCLRIHPFTAERRSMVYTWLFAESGRRVLEARLGGAGIDAEALGRAETLPALRSFMFGESRFTADAERVREPFARLGIDPSLRGEILRYVYDARVSRILGRILRPARQYPRYVIAGNPYADLPPLPLYTDYPPPIEMIFDVRADGTVGQCIWQAGLADDRYTGELCRALQARRYEPARDAEGRPVAGFATVVYGIWSDRLWEAQQNAARARQEPQSRRRR